MRPSRERRRTPSPSSSMMLRSMPAKTEKGPGATMVAMLTRQPKSDRPAPGGQHAISCVVPPPFFHGVTGRARREKCVRAITSVGLDVLLFDHLGPAGGFRAD